MAKRHLDLRGAKAPKLELDFLRLAVAVSELRRNGKKAQGYLLILTREIQERTNAWARKYNLRDAVTVLLETLSAKDRAMIAAEVKRNKAGMVAGTRGVAVRGRSSAVQGSKRCEAYLARSIRSHEPRVIRVRTGRVPLGIRWDYYGKVQSRVRRTGSTKT